MISGENSDKPTKATVSYKLTNLQFIDFALIHTYSLIPRWHTIIPRLKVVLEPDGLIGGV